MFYLYMNVCSKNNFVYIFFLENIDIVYDIVNIESSDQEEQFENTRFVNK